MRIKILGDCYYCISGLPSPDPEDKEKHISNPHHARNSVEMGLEMIDLIKEVREATGVAGLDMRIGVHTGRVLSGQLLIKKVRKKHILIKFKLMKNVIFLSVHKKEIIL